MKSQRWNEHQCILLYIIWSAVYDLIAFAADNVGYLIVRMAVQRKISILAGMIYRAGGMILLRLVGGLEFLLKDHIQPSNIIF